VLYCLNNTLEVTILTKTAMIVASLTLAACSDSDNKSSADINFSGDFGNGSDVAITADSDTGKVGVKLPGFEAKLNLPKAMLDKSNFELDGVKLYPGSKVTGVSVDAGLGSKDDAVRIAFSAPAKPGVVREWFIESFAAKAVNVTANATGLAGTDKDGSPFTMTLADSAGDMTAGTIVMTDQSK
jgi:hypothetical protein